MSTGSHTQPLGYSATGTIGVTEGNARGFAARNGDRGEAGKHIPTNWLHTGHRGEGLLRDALAHEDAALSSPTVLSLVLLLGRQRNSVLAGRRPAAITVSVLAAWNAPAWNAPAWNVAAWERDVRAAGEAGQME